MPKFKVTFTEVITYEVEIEAPTMPDVDSDWFERVEAQHCDDWADHVLGVSDREFDGADPVGE